MKAFAVTDISNFIDNDLIQCFHADMFHGIAERDGKEYPHDTKVWADTKSPSPLQVSRTGRNVPKIFRPSTHLVVCKSLAVTLHGVPNIRMAPILFKRLVDVPYCKGDHSWEKEFPHSDPCKYLRKMPDVQSFHDQIGTYYEVQTFRLGDVVGQFDSCKKVNLIEGTPPMEEEVTVELSEQLLIQYPMIWSPGRNILINNDVFNLLDDSIDRDFFIVREFVI